MKICSKCGFVGDEHFFYKGRGSCKKCISDRNKKYYEEHSEERKKYDKRYRKEHPRKREEDYSERLKQWRKEHPDYFKTYYKEHTEERKEYDKRYRKSHPGEKKEYNRMYRKTPNGKASAHRQEAKRRKLGHEPINEWFKGSEAHHLRYSKTHEEQDNNLTLYVPTKLHRSIPHNGNTGKNMKEINIACLEWYLNATPEKEHNPKAVKLYWNYCTLPEPEWSKDK